MLGLGSRRAEKAMERSIRRDSPVVRARMKALGPTWLMAFEDVLTAPGKAAAQLQQIVQEQFGRPFDAATAARAVVPRNPGCAPGFVMEKTILPLIAAELDSMRTDTPAQLPLPDRLRAHDRENVRPAWKAGGA